DSHLACCVIYIMIATYKKDLLSDFEHQFSPAEEPKNTDPMNECKQEYRENACTNNFVKLPSNAPNDYIDIGRCGVNDSLNELTKRGEIPQPSFHGEIGCAKFLTHNLRSL
ncbi:Hypothetical predicted protein, partial [Mytilus galloprovincialis]